jgi:hypothetical protein
MNEAALADALLKIGLGVKRSIFQTDKVCTISNLPFICRGNARFVSIRSSPWQGLVTEYEAVILPDDYPIKYILKAILIATR